MIQEDLATVHKLMMSRRAIRNFKKDSIPSDIMNVLLDCARWAPSGYNLQPTHFYLVSDPDLKQKLFYAAYQQRQILDAPCTVVFAADHNVVQNHFERIAKQDMETGAVNKGYVDFLRKILPFAFNRIPLNFLKRMLVAGMRFFKAMPNLPAEDIELWASKQAMLSAMNFMNAAHAADLGTCPMEGFDKERVRKVLQIPKGFSVPLICSVGYVADTPGKKSRIPLEDLTHTNCW